MNLPLLHCPPSHSYSSLNFPRISSQFSPKSTRKFNKTNHRTTTPFSFSPPKIPARDRVIDFGKYKGKMLGTLASNYLKWISKNLRARDFEEWAKLADEVLDDPVYRDRIEWEFAERILNGDVSSSVLMASRSNLNTVSEFLEISQRFGWDNEDKAGWSRIDFGLLGTSEGGRIPRISGGTISTAVMLEREKVGDSGDGKGETEEAVRGGERRKERREKVRLKRRIGGLQHQPSPIERTMRSAIGQNGRREDSEDVEGHRDDAYGIGFGMNSESTAEIRSPFPGRESLIKKVLSRRKPV